MARITARARVRRIVLLILAIVMTIPIVFPVFYMIIMGFRPFRFFFAGVESLTSLEFTLSNIGRALAEGKGLIYTAMGNSILVAGSTTLLVIVLSTLAGYALARRRIRFTRFFGALFMFPQIMPGLGILLPLYILYLFLRLLNSYQGIIIGEIAANLPLGVWLMAMFLATVPVELEEAALLDGSSRLGAIFRIVFPVALPGVVTTGFLIFLGVWGDFLFPYIVTSQTQYYLLPTFVYNFYYGARQTNITSFPTLMFVSTIYTLPALLLYFWLQRYLVKGFTTGSIVGASR